MFTTFKIVNFRSIVDLTLDFTFGEKRAPNGYRNQDRMPFIESDTVRAIPCLALFGANAAGKSNIIRAIRTFIEIISRPKVDVRDLYDPNQIVTCDAVTRFEAECVREGHRYRYAVDYTDEGLIGECLIADDKLLFSLGQTYAQRNCRISGADDQICFPLNNEGQDFSGLAGDPTYDLEKLKRVHAVECCSAEGKIVYALFPILGKDYGGLNGALSAAFQALSTGLFVLFDDFKLNTVPLSQMLPLTIDMMVKGLGYTQAAALQKVVDVVRKLDVDILALDIVEHGGEQLNSETFPYDLVRHERPSGKNFGISIYSEHRNDKDERVVFRFLERESEGTKRLAVVVAVILYALETGKTVFFDEFDRALHPLLVRELLSLFQKRSYNPHGAQLCFTTHCTDILDDSVLRMSEVGIVTKNIRTGTLIRRLTDFKNDGDAIRNVTNFRKQYLDGFYSGIPYPAI